MCAGRCANGVARGRASGESGARWTVSQSAATVSPGSASTVSSPTPHVTESTSPSRASILSLPYGERHWIQWHVDPLASPLITSRPGPPVIVSWP